MAEKVKPHMAAQPIEGRDSSSAEQIRAQALAEIAEDLKRRGFGAAAVAELMLAAGRIPDEFERLGVNQRVQHLILLVSFTVLCVTGFALMIPTERLPTLPFAGDALFDLRGLLHRIAAAWMVGLALYHLYYVTFTREGRRDLRDLMIRPLADMAEARDNLRYGLGLRDEPPRFDRVTYKDKLEYWALIWGTVVMTVTGIVLWSESLWSLRVLDICRAIHGYEAILAALAIVAWHIYNVHLRPGVFPMSKTWIDGKISREEMIEEHPLEYERLVMSCRRKESGPEE